MKRVFCRPGAGTDSTDVQPASARNVRAPLHGDRQAAAAEASFQQAIAIARRQSAKAWELRAVMSWCRLWQRQGRRDDAHRLLVETSGWFTEGFDTADLREAQALLGELQGSRR